MVVAMQVSLWTELPAHTPGRAATMPLSELKRRLVVGTRLTLIEAAYLPPGERRRRTVVHVQANAVELEDDSGGRSWLHWDRRTTVEVSGDGFRVKMARGVLAYVWGHD